MGRQLRKSNPRFGQDLVSAYICHVGGREQNKQQYSTLGPAHPMHASYLVGHGCMLLYSGNDRDADRQLRQARDNMRQHTEADRKLFDVSAAYGAHIFHIATMLLSRDDKGAQREFREAAHQQTIEELKRIALSYDKEPAKRGELKGRRNEQLMISVATRDTGDSEDALAAQSLVHHDMGRRQRDNYDVLLIDGVEEQIFQNQLKDDCADFCNGRKGVERGRAVCKKYTKKITVVSGHCDIHQGEPVALTTWLMDEADGRASPEIIENLNNRTELLIGTLVAPEAWRMGTISERQPSRR